MQSAGSSNLCCHNMYETTFQINPRLLLATTISFSSTAAWCPLSWHVHTVWMYASLRYGNLIYSTYIICLYRIMEKIEVPYHYNMVHIFQQTHNGHSLMTQFWARYTICFIGSKSDQSDHSCVQYLPSVIRWCDCQNLNMMMWAGHLYEITKTDHDHTNMVTYSCGP